MRRVWGANCVRFENLSGVPVQLNITVSLLLLCRITSDKIISFLFMLCQRCYFITLNADENGRIEQNARMKTWKKWSIIELKLSNRCVYKNDLTKTYQVLSKSVNIMWHQKTVFSNRRAPAGEKQLRRSQRYRQISQITGSTAAARLATSPLLPSSSSSPPLPFSPEVPLTDSCVTQSIVATRLIHSSFRELYPSERSSFRAVRRKKKCPP